MYSRVYKILSIDSNAVIIVNEMIIHLYVFLLSRHVRPNVLNIGVLNLKTFRNHKYVLFRNLDKLKLALKSEEDLTGNVETTCIYVFYNLFQM